MRGSVQGSVQNKQALTGGASRALSLSRPVPLRLGGLLTAAVLAGCLSPSAPMPGTQAARPSQLDQAAQVCAALAQFTAPSLRITEARLIAAGAERALDPAGNRPVGEPLPEHCKISGRLDERVGEDKQPYYTGFELRLPTQFSGRFFYQGGGGNDGVIRNAVGRNTGASGWSDHALARGFAVVATDAGHQSPAPNFGLDPQARIEHAWRAHQRTAETAKQIVSAYYRRDADRSYFVGCSGGGRQGMMFSQRFPQLFDGIIAVAPAMRVSEGATIAAAWTVQQFQKIAPAGADGKPVLSRAFSDGQLRRVAREVLARCDANDGLQDGLVQQPFCHVDVQPLVCRPGAAADDCLSQPQADALNAVIGGPRNSQGALYFSWPWDPGLAGADWRNWTLGTSTTTTPNARHITLMAGALGYEFVTPPDPSLTTLNFDLERDPARMQAFHKVYGSADDVQLDGYRQRGGKLLFFHGMADPIFSAHEMIDYQRRLNDRHGAAAPSIARTFLVPGMNHCAGGPATDDFDGLAALVDWVEHGKAPERIVAKGSGAIAASVSRPLCPWPKVARYVGGDANKADSFACQ